MMPETLSTRVLSVPDANALDARAAAGNVWARRRQAALIAIADQDGLPASSATSAALMLQNDRKAEIARRVAIMELRAAIDEDRWPVEVTVPDAGGGPRLVLVTGGQEARMLLMALGEGSQSTADMATLTQLELQDAMSKRQQAYQMLSNLLKSQHDTARAVIQNMR
jgi:hypothetical protein